MCTNSYRNGVQTNCMLLVLENIKLLLVNVPWNCSLKISYPTIEHSLAMVKERGVVYLWREVIVTVMDGIHNSHGQVHMSSCLSD